MEDERYKLSSAVNAKPRVPAFHSTLTCREFLQRLSQTLDGKGSAFLLETAETALIDEKDAQKKYAGEISKNVFFIRRPIIKGGKGVGVGISGRVLPSLDGCEIAIFCEPTAGQNMFVRISEIQFAAVLFLTFVVPFATSMPLIEIQRNFLASMVVSCPIYIGGLFLKTYFREYLMPDRELYEHVFSIAQDAQQMPGCGTEQ